MEDFEWTFTNVALAIGMVFVFGTVLWKQIGRFAVDRYTSRVRPGCALGFAVATLMSFFGTVGLITTYRQQARLERIDAVCLEAVNPMSVVVQPIGKNQQITVGLLGLCSPDAVDLRAAADYLSSKVLPQGKKVKLFLSPNHKNSDSKALGYVLTGKTLGSEAGVLMLKAGYARVDTNAVHLVHTLKTLQEAAQATALREKRGFWAEAENEDTERAEQAESTVPVKAAPSASSTVR